MRRAREQLARREPHNAHDVTYLRLTALEAHAREHGYDERIAAQAFAVFLAARNEVQIYADVAPALARLRRRYPLASLSNGNADLGSIGLAHAFTVSLNARQIGAAKPERRCFERLAQELGLGPGEILYVGDDPLLDVAAAREAGCSTAWMNRRAMQWPQDLAPRISSCTTACSSRGARAPEPQAAAAQGGSARPRVSTTRKRAMSAAPSGTSASHREFARSQRSIRPPPPTARRRRTGRRRRKRGRCCSRSRRRSRAGGPGTAPEDRR